MDIRFLESFVEVADCGSIAEAARRLNLTPAAVAQRLKALEEDLGHSLVGRAGRTVRPTASGLAVLGGARQMIEAARDLRAIAANDLPAGELRLGSTATMASVLMEAAGPWLNCPDLMPNCRDTEPADHTLRTCRLRMAPLPDRR